MDSEWFMIVGLGNPGSRYNGTRHNAGFETADLLIERHGIDGPVRFRKSLVGKGRISGQRVIVMKPMTYMNLSGEAVREGVDYYHIAPDTHLIVIVDDIDLEPGHLRIRGKGSPGGHNGLKSIRQHLGSDQYIRVRIGVGAKPSPETDLAAHVLGHPTGTDRDEIAGAMRQAADAVEMILAEGIEKTMCRYNH